MSVATLTGKAEQKPVKTCEEDMSQYLREIRQYPLLDAEQERQLAVACAAGDEEAIRTMVSANLRLVVSIARDYAGRGVPLLDLIQEGSIGLLVAAKKFDVAMETRFSTYATKWIRQCISRCILNHGSLIRVPAHTAQRIGQVMAAKTALQQSGGQEPTMEQIAKAAGVTEQKAEELLSLRPQICSLDAPGGEGSESNLHLYLEDLQAPQPQQNLVRRELKTMLEDLISNLTPRQQQVLRLHFGMDDAQCHSLEQIGHIMGISKERARQIQNDAINKLRKNGADLGLEDFLREWS